MRNVIQVPKADDAKAWALLQRHSHGMALPNRTFVVSDEAVQALRQAGVHVTLLSQESRNLMEERAASGERI